LPVGVAATDHDLDRLGSSLFEIIVSDRREVAQVEVAEFDAGAWQLQLQCVARTPSTVHIAASQNYAKSLAREFTRRDVADTAVGSSHQGDTSDLVRYASR
jgi:hypothetical protein